ncbi:MAG: hypothetical protein AAB383_00805 [Patescibacteria group bacterium]
MKKLFPFFLSLSLILSSCAQTSIPEEEVVSTQSHRSYEIEVTSDPSTFETGMDGVFTYKIKNDLGEVLKDFEVAHEKIMHFILVRKDLQEFQHVHPTYNENSGEFSINLVFAEAGPYRLFPDFTPGADNLQQLPVTLSYDLDVGDTSAYVSENLLANTLPVDMAESYEVEYTFDQLNLEPQGPVEYTLTIKKNGQIVDTLEPYLGAMGHSVILREGAVDFIHAHAESAGHDMSSMGEMSETSSISFATNFPEAGMYKIFTQFQHEEKVVTTEYIIEVGGLEEAASQAETSDQEEPVLEMDHSMMGH